MARQLNDETDVAPEPTPGRPPSRPMMGTAMAMARATARTALPFRAVNRSGAPDYDPGLQRHHLLPRQLLGKGCFAALFDRIGRDRLGFEDFRNNGLLLPCTEAGVQKMSLPLHRGPHHSYNAMVIERVGQIEQRWTGLRPRAPDAALDEAVQRLTLLQRALRRRLLKPRWHPFRLNRQDVPVKPVDFGELDTMVEALWADSAAPTAGPAMVPNSDEMALILPAGAGRADVPALRL